MTAVEMAMVGAGACGMLRETGLAASQLATFLLYGMGRWRGYAKHLGWPRKVDILVLCDSTAALQAIKHGAWDGCGRFRDLVEVLDEVGRRRRMGLSTRFGCVKANVGIDGNEKADQMAISKNAFLAYMAYPAYSAYKPNKLNNPRKPPNPNSCDYFPVRQIRAHSCS